MELIYPAVSIKLLLLFSEKSYTRTEIRKKISTTISSTIFNHIIEVLTLKNFIVVNHEYRSNASRATQVFYITDQGKNFITQVPREDIK